VYALASRAVVRGANFDVVRSDDPHTPVPGDSTVTLVHDAPTAVRVTDLSAVQTPGGVLVSWMVADDAGGDLSIGVQRAQSLLGPYVDRTLELLPGRTQSFLDTDIQAGETYWYRLELMEADGVRVLSHPVRVAVAGASWVTALDVPIVRAGEPVLLRYVIGRSGSPVRLEIFDVAGRRVRSLVQASQDAGRHEVTWDRRDGAGQSVARGIYVVRLVAGREDFTRKLTLAQ
jgi:hypothetical protein